MSVEKLLSDPDLQCENIPHAEVQDYCSTVFNSVSKDVLEARIEVLKTHLKPEHYHWLSLYLVKNRVLKEFNYHKLYAELLDGMKDLKLMDLVTTTTCDALRVLLKHVDQAVISTSHRTVLKNLGHWLGLITLARNKPLKARMLDLKALLLRAYDWGWLTAILPLVCKIMEGMQNSKVYKLPNPWTTAIISLLSEIHDLPSLRTNLMFEVEVLCNNNKIPLAEVLRSTLLLDRVPANSNDFTAARQKETLLPGTDHTSVVGTPSPAEPHFEMPMLPKDCNDVVPPPLALG